MQEGGSGKLQESAKGAIPALLTHMPGNEGVLETPTPSNSREKWV